MELAGAYVLSMTTLKGILTLVASALLFLIFLYPRDAKGGDNFPSWVLLEGHLIGFCIIQDSWPRKLLCVSPVLIAIHFLSNMTMSFLVPTSVFILSLPSMV